MATKQINDIHVAEKLSRTFRDVLYADTIWIPGVTFTEAYAEQGVGKIYVNKLEKTNSAPKTPGQDFTDTEGETTQVAINLNNSFDKSEKVRRVTMAQLHGDETLQAETFDKVLSANREDWNLAMTAKVADEAEVYSDVDEIDADNLKAKVISMRTKLRKRKIRPNFMIVSPEVYGAMLDFKGKEFTPNSNQEAFDRGIVGSFLGITVIESNNFDENEAKYRDASDNEQTVDLTDKEIIMGRYQDIANVVNLEMARLKDSEFFNGVKAQTELVAGFGVLDPERILLKEYWTEIKDLTLTSVDGTESGDTKITIAEDPLFDNTKYYYETNADENELTDVSLNDTLTGFTEWDGKSDLTITDDHYIQVVEVNKDGKALAKGSVQVNTKA